MGKSIVFLVASPPYATLNNYEALRTSLALIDHKLSIVWTGNGVHFPIIRSDKSNTRNIINLFSDLNIHLFVDEESLVEKGYNAQDIIPEVSVIGCGEVINMLSEADFVLSF